MIGPPDFEEVPIPSWDDFNKDYHDYYFDGSEPLNGRCFIIVVDGEEIGQINYNEIDTASKSTEIDIWLADREFTGKGFGTEAIGMLCEYLAQAFECEKIYIAPSIRNKNAVKSYTKAGFVETDVFPDYFVPDYKDTVVMVKEMKKMDKA